jgi:hypothetical protein
MMTAFPTINLSVKYTAHAAIIAKWRGNWNRKYIMNA